MNTIIETDRFILREFMLEDAEDCYLLNADPEVIKYTGDEPFKSVDEAKTFLENYNPYVTEGFGRWACILKETGAFTGWCGLRMQPDIGMVDLGYRFMQKYWCKGYATETALASLEFGFKVKGLDVIVGRAHADNAASIQVLQKVGMTFYKDFDYHDGPSVEYRIHNPYK